MPRFTHRIETAPYDTALRALGPWQPTPVTLTDPQRHIGALPGALLRLTGAVRAEQDSPVRAVPALPEHAAAGADGTLRIGYGPDAGLHAWRLVQFA